MQKQKADWSAYLNRWNGIFYDPDKDDTGGWIYSDYYDHNRTIKNFPKLPAYKMLLISALVKLKRKFD